MKYCITLELFVDAMDKNDAQEIGTNAVIHLLDTFDDNETIRPLYRINVQQIKGKV